MVFLLVAFAAAAQDVQPPWIIIAEADRHASEKAYGIAIRLYREALAQQPGNPEALYGLGRAFKSVGDYGEAEGYLLDAIESSARLEVADELYAIRYDLADLYHTRRDFARYEIILTEIVESSNAEPVRPGTVRPDRLALRSSFLTAGLDRTLVLYRLPEDGGTLARGELCEFLGGLGRYANAVDFGLVAVLQRMTTLVEALMDRDPSFEFTGVRDALLAAPLYPETRSYISEGNIYRDLYCLGSAAWSDGQREAALSLWRLVSELDEGGNYGVRARMQLADPQSEPLLIPPQ